jgi:CHASE3 domain sensor protein
MPNFDMQSKSSAYFVNEDELADYEEKMQNMVQEKWSSIEKKHEQYQKEYQKLVEQIMEDIAEQKFEEMAEIKAVMKKIDPSETEAIAEKQEELN